MYRNKYKNHTKPILLIVPTNIGCCLGTFVQVVLKGSILASATTTEICNGGRSARAHALGSIRPLRSLT